VVTFRVRVAEHGVHDAAHEGVHEGVHDDQVGLSEIEERILRACATDSQAASAPLKVLGYPSRTRNFRNAIAGLLERQLLGMTEPGKSRSKNQMYFLTRKGRTAIK
jgi:hypothetical protein